MSQMEIRLEAEMHSKLTKDLKNLKIISHTDGRAGKYGINLSSEISFLIKEAGKCDFYASDVMYGINDIMEAVEAGEEHLEWFGFRESGVDHWNFIESRLKSGTLRSNYRSIYFIVVQKDDKYYKDGIVVTLCEAWKRL